MSRKARREGRGKVGFRVKGEAIAETVGGKAYLSDESTGTGEKRVVVFIVPGVELVDAATELRLLAAELEEQALGRLNGE